MSMTRPQSHEESDLIQCVRLATWKECATRNVSLFGRWFRSSCALLRGEMASLGRWKWADNGLGDEVLTFWTISQLLSPLCGPSTPGYFRLFVGLGLCPPRPASVWRRGGGVLSGPQRTPRRLSTGCITSEMSHGSDTSLLSLSISDTIDTGPGPRGRRCSRFQ